MNYHPIADLIRLIECHSLCAVAIDFVLTEMKHHTRCVMVLELRFRKVISSDSGPVERTIATTTHITQEGLERLMKHITAKAITADWLFLPNFSGLGWRGTERYPQTVFPVWKSVHETMGLVIDK